VQVIYKKTQAAVPLHPLQHPHQFRFGEMVTEK